MKNDVNVPQKVISGNFFFICKSGSISQRHGSADPDPDSHQNVMDSQHCLLHNSADVVKADFMQHGIRQLSRKITLTISATSVTVNIADQASLLDSVCGSGSTWIPIDLALQDPNPDRYWK